MHMLNLACCGSRGAGSRNAVTSVMLVPELLPPAWWCLAQPAPPHSLCRASGPHQCTLHIITAPFHAVAQQQQLLKLCTLLPVLPPDLGAGERKP